MGQRRGHTLGSYQTHDKVCINVHIKHIITFALMYPWTNCRRNPSSGAFCLFRDPASFFLSWGRSSLYTWGGFGTRVTQRFRKSMKDNSRDASGQSAVKIMSGLKQRSVCVTSNTGHGPLHINLSVLPGARSSSGLPVRCPSPVRERRIGRSRIRRCWSRRNPLWTENTIKI